MAFNVSSGSGGNYTPAPAGTHRAVCSKIVDLGTIATPWGPKHYVMIGWELPDERISYQDKEGNDVEGPFMAYQRYNLTLGSESKPSNLRSDLESWRGKPFTKEEEAAFDLSKLLGKGCLVTIVHNVTNGKTYANVSSVVALPKSMQTSGPEGPSFCFTFSEWDGVTPPPVSTHLLEKLRNTPEWLACAKHEDGGQHDDAPPPGDEDIPF